MSNQAWSWLLAIMGIAGMFFVGKKRWEAFVWLIVVECLWTIFAITSNQHGFILGSIVYGVVYVKNAIRWRKEDLVKNV